MTIESQIGSPSQVLELFTSANMTAFNATATVEDPYENAVTMLYRAVGKMGAIYRLGPSPITDRILAMDEQWPGKFGTLKGKLIERKIYAFLTLAKEEGGTVFGLAPDSSFLKESSTPLKDLALFNATVKDDIKAKRWMSAFSNAQRKVKGDAAPFALSFIASYTTCRLPFFGRTAWGLAEKNGILSITQIPLMVPANRDQSFSWSFVTRSHITDAQLASRFPKGGGSSSFASFSEVRKFLLNKDECQPLNPKGSYTFAAGDEEPHVQKRPKGSAERGVDSKEDNPLLDATQQQAEESVNESYQIARSFLIDEAYRIQEYRMELEQDSGKEEDDVEDVGDTKASYPSGYPTRNTIKKSGAGNVPLLGPCY